MKHKPLRILVIIIGVLVLLLLAGPILTRMGFEPFCITGEFPDLKIGQCPKQAFDNPTVTPYLLPTAASESPISIIFDDDGSPDGLIALLYFLRNPLYEVRAVTVSQGEAHPQLFARHLAQFLANFGRDDIPVGFGREAPLEGDNAFPEPWRKASDLFYEIPLSESASASEPRPAAEIIIETLTQSTEPMVIFISGSHTNLAEVLRINPDIREKISRVYVMGGSIYVPGNIESDWPEIHNTVAEWNIWVDPLAAREVFTAELPLHLVPIDATNQITWTKADVQVWRSIFIPEANMAGDILDWMLRSLSLDAAYIWDLVAAVVATDPRLCPEVRLALDVNVDPGSDQGQTIVTNETGNAWVCLEPDVGQIQARVKGILGK
jgi:pyrimidine-specific ribonucleoside hydrolase